MTYKLICPVCKKEGKKSQVRFNNSQTVLAVAQPPPYWDEDGNYHEFPAPKVPAFRCTKGHEFDDDEYWKTPIEC